MRQAWRDAPLESRIFGLTRGVLRPRRRGVRRQHRRALRRHSSSAQPRSASATRPGSGATSPPPGKPSSRPRTARRSCTSPTRASGPSCSGRERACHHRTRHRSLLALPRRATPDPGSGGTRVRKPAPGVSGSPDAAKEAAGRAGADEVRNGMRVGLGTGSTVNYTIVALGERGLDLVAWPRPSAPGSSQSPSACGSWHRRRPGGWTWPSTGPTRWTRRATW